jgi:hypothetical protein
MVAVELLELAGVERVSRQHLRRLVCRYEERRTPPGTMRVVREIGDDLCSWEAGGHTTPRSIPPRTSAILPPPIDGLDLASELPAKPSLPPWSHASAGNRSMPPGWTVSPSNAPTLTVPPALARRSGGRGLGAVVMFVAVVASLVGAFFAFRHVSRDRARPVEGSHASAHLGISVELGEPWSHAYDRDAAGSRGAWQRRSSVFFRGSSAADFDSELIITTLAKTSGADVAAAEIRSEGASETVGFGAVDRECNAWKTRPGATICNSFVRQANRTYAAREYMFSTGKRIVYVLTLHLVRGAKSSADQEQVDRQSGEGIAEANAIAKSIEAL